MNLQSNLYGSVPLRTKPTPHCIAKIHFFLFLVLVGLLYIYRFYVMISLEPTYGKFQVCFGIVYASQKQFS